MKVAIIILAMAIVAVQAQYYGGGATMGSSSVAPQTTGQMAGMDTTTGYATTGMTGTVTMMSSSAAPVTATNGPATNAPTTNGPTTSMMLMMTSGYASTSGPSSVAPLTTSQPVATTTYHS